MLSAEKLVAGFHVGEVEVGKHVGEEGEPLVSDGMPEEEDAVGVAAGESGAIDDIGVTVEHGLEEEVVFSWVVFEVCVLDDDEIAGGMGYSGV